MLGRVAAASRQNAMQRSSSSVIGRWFVVHCVAAAAPVAVGVVSVLLLLLVGLRQEDHTQTALGDVLRP